MKPCVFVSYRQKKKKKSTLERENRKEMMQDLGCRVTYIYPSLEFPAAFPRCAASNWELGYTDTGSLLLPVNKDNQARTGVQVLHLLLAYCNFFVFKNMIIFCTVWFYTMHYLLVSMETVSIM